MKQKAVGHNKLDAALKVALVRFVNYEGFDMSIAKILRQAFDSNSGPVSFEAAYSVCASHGLVLNLGTYRVNKSLWLKDKGLKERTVSTAVATAPQPVPASTTVVETPVITDFGDVNFEDDATEDLKSFFEIPKMDDSHILNDEMTALFDAIHKASSKAPQNIRLNGPAGCGKTTTAMEFAARFKRPLLVMDCPNVREPRDWFGFKTIDNKSGQIVWHKSLFSRFIQTKGAVVVLDEVNRLSPMICNTLLPLLDGRRQTYLEEAGSKIVVGQGVVFFATTNEGREFTGTTSLDLAHSDRFGTLIEVTYLKQEDEIKLLVERTGINKDDANKLVSIANTVRRKAVSDSADSFSKGISTRILLNAAEKVVLGGHKTLRYTLLTHFNSDGGETSERGQLLKLLQGKFGALFS